MPVFDFLSSTIAMITTIRTAVNVDHFVARTHASLVLNKNPDWRRIFGPVNPRMRDQELILRFLALNYAGDRFGAPMKEFLNSFMGRHRNMDRLFPSQLTKRFGGTVHVIFSALGEDAFRVRRSIVAAVFDSVMIGVARRLRKDGPILKEAQVRTASNRLLENEKFQDAITTHTADKKNDFVLQRRLSLM
jgi:hypothetical protein